ncbi:Bax inhibitor-1/YccA family membrane protein [Candidatus Epulonipiscium viviparus]|uniref:Bax inhibitor-1/YccA family membrane protein n=1 Tax=Candidatus Epulonipiscium viviparus TaxID=420336 RepID=UPI00273811F7|nr:Bax inhibitor-1/YccA family protein [Candidatus Epulopiscium viviparus]
MRSNPMIKKGLEGNLVGTGEAMSIAGARNKSLAFISLTCIFALITFVALSIGSVPNFGLANILGVSSGIVGFILLIAMVFKPHLSSTIGSFYAIFEGVFVGAITLRFSYFFDGVVPKAALLTLLAIAFTLLLYKEKPDLAGKIRMGVIILTMTICAASIMGLIFFFLGWGNVLMGNGLISIGFSILTVIVAIANLMLDYDNIVVGARHGLPKYMESFFAVGLLVTVVWVYVEMLSLLAKLASRE